MFMVGILGFGKFMLVVCIFGILLFFGFVEVFEILMIYLIVGLFDNGGIDCSCLFCELYYIVSMVVIVGGGCGVKLGEISFVYNGVLFMDEFLEFF